METPIKKKVRSRRCVRTYETYIARANAKLNTGNVISGQAVRALDDTLVAIGDRLIKTVCQIARQDGKATLTEAHLTAAIHLLFPRCGDLIAAECKKRVNQIAETRRQEVQPRVV